MFRFPHEKKKRNLRPVVHNKCTIRGSSETDLLAKLIDIEHFVKNQRKHS